MILSGCLALAGLGSAPNIVEAVKVKLKVNVSVQSLSPMAKEVQADGAEVVPVAAHEGAGAAAFECLGAAEHSRPHPLLCTLLEIMKRDISEVLANATDGGKPFPTEQIRAVFPQFQSGFECMGLDDELKQVSIARIGAGGNCEGVFPYERRKDAGEDSDSLSPLPDKVAVKKIKRRILRTSVLNLEVLEWKALINEVVNMLMLNVKAAEGLGGDELFSVVKLHRVYVSIEDVCENKFTATVCLVQDLGDSGGDFFSRMFTEATGASYCVKNPEKCLKKVEQAHNREKVTTWLGNLKKRGEGLQEATVWYRKNNFGHGDIKPDNIIFVEGKPALVDVASMHIFSDDGAYCKTETCVHVSLPYVAPEKLSTVFTDPRTDYDLEATHRWDNFALGVVLLEALSANPDPDWPLNAIKVRCHKENIARNICNQDKVNSWNRQYLPILAKTLDGTYKTMEQLVNHVKIYELYSQVYHMIYTLFVGSSAIFASELEKIEQLRVKPSFSPPERPTLLRAESQESQGGADVEPGTPTSRNFSKKESTELLMGKFMEDALKAGKGPGWSIDHRSSVKLSGPGGRTRGERRK